MITAVPGKFAKKEPNQLENSQNKRTIFAILLVIPAKAGIHSIIKLDTRLRGYDISTKEEILK